MNEVRPAGTPGFLVTIDGPADVGKTTVAAWAAARLAELGVPAVVTRQPSDSALGVLARASTYDLRGLPLSFLMAADRYHHQDHVITPALRAGRVVVCDRYYRYMRWPDLAIILTGDPAVCRERAAARGIYSRFHEGGAGAGKSEAALCASVVGRLAGYGCPVEVLEIGDRSAEQVGGAVLGLIKDDMTTTVPSDEGGTLR